MSAGKLLAGSAGRRLRRSHASGRLRLLGRGSDETASALSSKLDQLAFHYSAYEFGNARPIEGHLDRHYPWCRRLGPG